MTTRTTLLALFLGLITPSVFALPDWIWIDSPKTSQEVVFHHAFDVEPARLESAHLRLVADFATVKLTINGRQKGIAEAFGRVLKLRSRKGAARCRCARGERRVEVSLRVCASASANL